MWVEAGALRQLSAWALRLSQFGHGPVPRTSTDKTDRWGELSGADGEMPRDGEQWGTLESDGRRDQAHLEGMDKGGFRISVFSPFFCWQRFSPIATAPVGVSMLPGHPLWALFRVPRPRDPLGNSVACKE